MEVIKVVTEKDGKLVSAFASDKCWRWTTRDGRKLAIGELSPSHLQHIINYLESRLQSLQEGVYSYYRFPPQGEMAAWLLNEEVESAEREITRLEDLLSWLRQRTTKP